MQRRKRILLFGANGQVGFEVRRLFGSSHELIAYDREPGPAWLALDLTNREELRAVLTSTEPDLIVNAAAYAQVDKAETEFELALAINGKAPGIIAEVASASGIPLIHFSTDYVYRSETDLPMDEDEPTRPLNLYGESKLVGDEAVLASGANAVIFRTSWVFGVHGHNFVKTMLRLAREREELSVVCDQWGGPSSARMLAAACLHVSVTGTGKDAEWWRKKRGVFHLCNSGYTSWHAFAEEIFRQAQAKGEQLAIKRVLPILSKDYPTPARRPHNSRLILDKIRNTWGFQPASWQDALCHDFFGNQI